MRLFQRDRHRRDDLSAYIDGQLNPRRREAVEGHLAGCAYCRQELEELRAMVGMLQRVTEVETPRSFTLTEVPTVAPAWTVRYTAPLRYATATAALLLVAVVTGDLVTSSQASEPMRATMEASQDTDSPADEAPAMEMAAPDKMPAPAPAATAEMRTADDDTGGKLEPAQAPDELDTTNILLRWVEAALGLVVVALVVVAAVQWRTARRIKAR